MSGHTGSRIAAAKQRTSDAKRTLVVGAVGAFVGAVGLAWASHPGSSASATSGAGDTASVGQDEGAFFFGEDDEDDFGGFNSSGSIAPSGGAAPQVQTHVS